MPDTDNFEWDKDKAVANWQKHGVSFEEATGAFRDPFAIEMFDDRLDYGEERISLIALYNGVIHHVTYTERGERIRLISARRATKYERDDYYRQNAAGWDGS
ncbi:BrnT family toxin [Nostoc sp.]|uniref:BrnT family toxin n=1 Tax=Nostoc sp. TaxID=1180 RepID=UPI002FF91905